MQYFKIILIFVSFPKKICHSLIVAVGYWHIFSRESNSRDSVVRPSVSPLVCNTISSSKSHQDQSTLITIHLFNYSSPLSRLLRLLVLFIRMSCIVWTSAYCSIAIATVLDHYLQSAVSVLQYDYRILYSLPWHFEYLCFSSPFASFH